MWEEAQSPCAEPERHRYLTDAEDERFMDANQLGVESTRYAFRLSKQLLELNQ